MFSKDDSDSETSEEETGPVPEVPLPEVSKDKFYEISDSLKDTFISKAKAPTQQSGTFSLLAAFGKAGNEQTEDTGMEYEGQPDMTDPYLLVSYLCFYC